jgi:hypothetical protein
MFSPEVTALLRAILDEVCADLSEFDAGRKALVASKLLESASKGELSADILRSVGRRALNGTPSMWDQSPGR